LEGVPYRIPVTSLESRLQPAIEAAFAADNSIAKFAAKIENISPIAAAALFF
jgi:hypothetical protein